MTKRVVLFALSLAFSGLVFAQSQQAVRDQLFGPTDALKKSADAVNAKMLGPTAYADAMKLYKEAGDTLEKGKDINTVKEDLNKTNGLLQKSTEAAKLAQVTFADTLTARAAAEKAEAAKYAAKDWGKAEASLTEAAEQLEDGNLNKASKTAHDATSDYKETESKAINAKAKATH
jgi:hypothetical protein